MHWPYVVPIFWPVQTVESRLGNRPTALWNMGMREINAMISPR